MYTERALLKTVSKIILLSILVLPSARTFACASCGSGGDDPLILYPWETFKIYTGFARTSAFTPIDAAGRSGRELSPDVRNTTTVSMGKTLSNRSFVTVTAPYIVNKREEYQRSAWGDPMITARYTAVTQDISQEWIPQVQFIAAAKAGSANSVFNYQDPARLDVFGSGVPEWRAGVDIWHAMFDWKAGVAQTITGPLSSRKTEFGEVRHGVAFRSTATVGYGWGDFGKLLVGVNREQTTKKSLDGETQADSDIVGQSAFLSADAKIEHHSSVRLTLSKTAAFGPNKNISRSEAVTVAVMRAF
jgi:hypothetical protein